MSEIVLDYTKLVQEMEAVYGCAQMVTQYYLWVYTHKVSSSPEGAGGTPPLASPVPISELIRISF